MLITITEPEGAAPATLVRRHTEISGIWRDFADDPELRVAVITGTGDHFWTVEGTDGIEEMLENPGDYNNVIHLIREGLVNAHSIVNCDKPIVSAINGEAMGSGLATALLADISIASTKARLIDGHLLQGIAAGDHSVRSGRCCAGWRRPSSTCSPPRTSQARSLRASDSSAFAVPPQ